MEQFDLEEWLLSDKVRRYLAFIETEAQTTVRQQRQANIQVPGAESGLPLFPRKEDEK